MSKDCVEKSLRLVKTRGRSRKQVSSENCLKRSTEGKSSWARRKGLRKRVTDSRGFGLSPTGEFRTGSNSQDGDEL